MQKRLREAHPTKYFVTSFETYQAINSKSGNCTIMETFARMLMCVRGMTQEKVCLVLDVWQTPLAMWQAFKQRRIEFALEMEEERQRGPIRGKSKVRPLELFFADAVESRSARQKIGDSLSREVSWPWFLLQRPWRHAEVVCRLDQMYAVFCA
jgi:crossover junction endonuclease MUS81